MNEQLLPITLDAKNGLAYTEDFALIRAMLKHEPSLTELVDAIERDALGLVADPTDKEGNRQIRENADWVKKCGKRLEKIRTEAVADLKREPKIIEDSVRPHLKRLEALAVQIMAPVAEMDARADRLRIIADRPNILSAAPIAQLEQELATAQAMTTDEAEWKERTREAELVKIGLVEALEALLAKRKQDEADRLELDRLRAEKAEKEMRERIERETREKLAREAEQAAIAEARAKREAADAVAAEETISSKITAIRTAKSVEDAASIIVDELSTQPTETPYQQAYQDIRAVMAKNGFGDLAAAILAAATAGKIRHISTHL